MARAAIDRSAGGCESFRGPADMDLLAYLAGRSPSLRSIHVTSWLRVPEKEFVAGVIRKLPLLERLVLSSGIFDEPEPVMRALLDHCPCLELLNAGGCVTAEVTSRRVRARCAERIRDLRLPEYFYRRLRINGKEGARAYGRQRRTSGGECASLVRRLPESWSNDVVPTA
ncbi:hypothetical protein E2562_000519 [Oryza meyeriana var. granulata]|uniref:FBD domain-containing protein n=1 Tax=Oryza meyeriana var. granulata TaxID=110450 RepID=A0A6G1CDW0_9ORYZ|nr:hypothetical protein E2562_000519 [Oryza meyeriana var. granulata]